jgi:hypothetical protein
MLSALNTSTQVSVPVLAFLFEFRAASIIDTLVVGRLSPSFLSFSL